MREPTEPMIDKAIEAAKATEAGRECELDNLPEASIRFMFQQALVAALDAQYMDCLPAYEPPTCGSDYLIAERALRVIEQATMLGESVTAEAINCIDQLADRAGSAFNRQALRSKPRLDADDLPF